MAIVYMHYAVHVYRLHGANIKQNCHSGKSAEQESCCPKHQKSGTQIKQKHLGYGFWKCIIYNVGPYVDPYCL